MLSFLLKRLNSFVTCLFSKCLELLLQLTEHSIHSITFGVLRKNFDLLATEFLVKSTFFGITTMDWHHDHTLECVMVTSFFSLNVKYWFKVLPNQNSFLLQMHVYSLAKMASSEFYTGVKITHSRYEMFPAKLSLQLVVNMFWAGSPVTPHSRAVNTKHSQTSPIKGQLT